MHCFSSEERVRLVRQVEAGSSVPNIARLFGIARRTADLIAQKYILTGTVKDSNSHLSSAQRCWALMLQTTISA